LFFVLRRPVVSSYTSNKIATNFKKSENQNASSTNIPIGKIKRQGRENSYCTFYTVFPHEKITIRPTSHAVCTKKGLFREVGQGRAKLIGLFSARKL